MAPAVQGERVRVRVALQGNDRRQKRGALFERHVHRVQEIGSRACVVVVQVEEVEAWGDRRVVPDLAARVEEVVVALAEYGVERPGRRMRDGEIEVRQCEVRRGRRIRRRVPDRKAQYVLNGIVPIEMKRLELVRPVSVLWVQENTAAPVVVDGPPLVVVRHEARIVRVHASGEGKRVRRIGLQHGSCAVARHGSRRSGGGVIMPVVGVVEASVGAAVDLAPIVEVCRIHRERGNCTRGNRRT